LRAAIRRLEQSRGRTQQEGFTLIELLIVIIILGILAAIVVFAVSGVGDKGAAASCEEDTRILQTAQESNFAERGSYASEPDLVANGFLGKESAYHDTTDVSADSVPGGVASPGYLIRVQNDQCGQLEATPDPAPDPDGAGPLPAAWPAGYECPVNDRDAATDLAPNGNAEGNCGNVVDAQHPNNK